MWDKETTMKKLLLIALAAALLLVGCGGTAVNLDVNAVYAQLEQAAQIPEMTEIKGDMLLNLYDEFLSVFTYDFKRLMNSRQLSGRLIIKIKMHIDHRADDLRYISGKSRHMIQFRQRRHSRRFQS